MNKLAEARRNRRVFRAYRGGEKTQTEIRREFGLSNSDLITILLREMRLENRRENIVAARTKEAKKRERRRNAEAEEAAQEAREAAEGLVREREQRQASILKRIDLIERHRRRHHERVEMEAIWERMSPMAAAQSEI